MAGKDGTNAGAAKENAEYAAEKPPLNRLKFLNKETG